MRAKLRYLCPANPGIALKSDLVIPESEFTITATRASGPGGQHVNKVSTAVVLRFDIPASSLPEPVKHRLLSSSRQQITEKGVLVIKSGASRSQLRNKNEAVRRLHEIVHQAARPKKKRKPTKPPESTVEKRINEKTRRGEIKAQRKKLKPPPPQDK